MGVKACSSACGNNKQMELDPEAVRKGRGKKKMPGKQPIEPTASLRGVTGVDVSVSSYNNVTDSIDNSRVTGMGDESQRVPTEEGDTNKSGKKNQLRQSDNKNVLGGLQMTDFNQ